MSPDLARQAPDWDAAAVAQGTAHTRFANRIQHLAVTASTNTLALEAAQAGAPEGAVWVADEQTAGRGRGGHSWHSEPCAGLYFSLLLRPQLTAEHSLWLSLATGLAVQSAVLETTGHQPDIRWPNDLLLPHKGAEKKFGGILVETAVTPESTLRHAVIGIGVNVGHSAFQPELESIATSLLLATGKLYSRELLLAAILRALDRELASLDSSSSTVLDRFSRASTWVQGKAVRVGDEESYTGVTAGLDPRGFLRVLADDGTLRTVLSGGVRPL